MMDGGTGKRVLAQFKSEEGQLVGFPFDVPVEASHESLSLLCNAILENVRGWQPLSTMHTGYIVYRVNSECLSLGIQLP